MSTPADTNVNLCQRMRERAITHHHDRPDIQANLIQHAQALEDVAGSADVSIPKLVGTWARARKYWCELTGESLI